MDDALLGEKAAGYCSSSSDEEVESPAVAEEINDDVKATTNTPAPWTGNSCNTGPKGVLRDWKLFKEHELAVRDQKEAEYLAYIANKALSCRPESLEENENVELETTEDDALQDFLKKRMKDMMKSHQSDLPTYGELKDIQCGDEFLKAIDETPDKVLVIIHIYESRSRECVTMNDCLNNLSSTYPKIKFCRVLASIAGLSSEFKSKGVPALLVYKGGTLIGNFVRLKEEFGSEFYPGDVENFLIENGIIQDESNIPSVLKTD